MTDKNRPLVRSPKYRFLRNALLAVCIGLNSLSCTKKEDTELQKNIRFLSTGSEIVLPNTLTNTVDSTDDNLSKYYTCDSKGSVAGPRIRIRNIVLQYSGSNKLIPLFIQFKTEDKQLAGSYTVVFTPKEGSSLASYFRSRSSPSTTEDYILSSEGELSTELTGNPGLTPTSRCYFDLGGLPIPTTPPKGSAKITATGKLTLSAVEVDNLGNQTPVIKEATMNLVYVDGSVPLK